MSIGLPKIRVVFENAAEAILTRAKKGVVGVIVLDSSAPGVHEITDVEDIPSTLSADNKAYAARALMGTDLGKPTKLVLVVAAPDGEDAATPATVPGALALLAGRSVDYLAGPPNMTEAEVSAVKEFVSDYREDNPTLQAVLPTFAADDRGISNYTSTVFVGPQIYGPGVYASRIAGALAGLPSTASCTNLALREVTGVAPIPVTDGKTQREAQNAAIKAGELIVIYDGTTARIARGVNSLTTLASGEPENLKKIKVTEGEGLLHYYTEQAIREGYQGKVVNSYDNRCLLVVELGEMYAKLERQGILLPGTSHVEIDVAAQRAYLEDAGVDCNDMDDDQVRQYENLGDNVFILAGGTFADTMENFTVRFGREL